MSRKAERPVSPNPGWQVEASPLWPLARDPPDHHHSIDRIEDVKRFGVVVQREANQGREVDGT